MRQVAILMAGVVALMAPMQALATVYDFKETESSAFGPASFSFALDTATAVENANGTVFNNVAIDDSGVVSTGNTIVAIGDMEISSPLFFLIDTSMPPAPFDSGAGTGIEFATRSFNIANGFNDAEGVLAISAAPEPSSWVLMILGVGVVGAALRFGRRRLQALTAT